MLSHSKYHRGLFIAVNSPQLATKIATMTIVAFIDG